MFSLFYYLYMFLAIASPSACIVMGVLIARKKMLSRFLGCWAIASGAAMLSDPVNMLLARYMTIETFAHFSSVVNAAVTLLTVTSYIVILCYVYVKYEFKWIIPILVFAVMCGPVLSTAIRITMNTFTSDAMSLARNSYFANLIGTLPVIIVWLILLYIFIRSKSKEAYLKAAWIVPLAALLCSVIDAIANINAMIHIAEGTYPSMGGRMLQAVLLFIAVLYVLRKEPKEIRA